MVAAHLFCVSKLTLLLNRLVSFSHLIDAVVLHFVLVFFTFGPGGCANLISVSFATVWSAHGLLPCVVLAAAK